MINIPDKALSIRQPWAFAIAMGWKPVENRSWKGSNPDLNFRGPFAIHASQGMTRDEYESAADCFADCGFTCPPAADLQRGGIIGVGRVTDVVTRHDSPWFFGPKALVVADAEPVDFISVGGQLGFFDWRRLLPFAKNGKPVEPAKWMLPPDPKAEKVRAPKVRPPAPDAQGTLL